MLHRLPLILRMKSTVYQTRLFTNIELKSVVRLWKGKQRLFVIVLVRPLHYWNI